MKKIILLFSLFLLSSSVFGQIDLSELEMVDGLWTKKGENQPYNGDFKATFEDGTTYETGSFVNGQLDGLRIYNFPSGKIKSKTEYKDGYPHGQAKEYYEDGTLKEEGSYENGEYDGTWIYYYPNGNKVAVVTFEIGFKNGPSYMYNENGILTVQGYYKNENWTYSDEFLKLSKEALELSNQFENEEAINLYNKAIEINPTVPQAYFNRGACKGHNFDFAGAIKDYDKAIEINPQYIEAYENRGNAKINMFTSKGTLDPTPEQTASACEDFHKAKELGDTSIGIEDMINLHCKKNKTKKKK